MSFEGSAKVDARTQLYDACGLQIRVATSGPCGGDGGHGGWSGLTLEGDAMLFDVRIGYQGELDDEVEADFVRIVCRGDAEGRLLAEGLRFAADVLEAEHGFTGPQEPPEPSDDPAIDPVEQGL